jgi:hypothetical protein
VHLSRNSRQNFKLWTTSQDYAVVACYVKSNKGFKPFFPKKYLGKIQSSQGPFTPSKHCTIASQNLIKDSTLVGHFFVV